MQREIDEAKIAAVLQSGSERCIVGDSPQIRTIFNLIRKYASSDAPVLITGETGTGKELIAHAIHDRSPRAHGPFRVINCAAIPPTLIASELFGYEKGAFTGAVSRKKGIIEAAQGGTLFLDEVGHLPADMQGYLLRVLQEKTIQLVGGVDQIPVDVRIVSATNVDFASLIEAGTFRSDLFFRLKVLTIHSPPLRERGHDILTLALFFLRKFAAEMGRDEMNFTEAAQRRLLSYGWPGNIRELMAAIQRAVVVCDDDVIDVGDLEDGFVPDLVAAPAPIQPPSPANDTVRRPRADRRRSNTERRSELVDMIRRCGGNLTEAAENLGISRMTIYRLIERFKLDQTIQDIRNECRQYDHDCYADPTPKT
ncbi:MULTISPECIES: sigma-54-dependent Fis family transcriptional regulator [unclassified Acidiphilium]|uniref:sigma-54 interaction domain-containing protein n=1 Tax=unclassified Acidiphilium TaxID=2617493 RepID=UPI001F1794D3|nr:MULTISPECIES: sigma-54 dependent transcriptional regulator [unclassified Acidiphilium]HQT60577.1 sigma-54 dependent transcriptional regulator [Acidiphilium sp.]